MTVAAPLLFAAFPLALIAAALSDIRRFIIPNWTALLLIGGFAVAALAALATGAMSLGAVAVQIAVGAGFLALGFGLWSAGIWGGGDGKLIAAAALWFDPSASLAMLTWVAIIGGGLGAIGLSLHLARAHLAHLPGFAALDLEKLGKSAPYGVAIAAGALIALPQSALFQALLG